ncbi:hypothetical protein GCM10020255_105140 [Rhodococcus baikonurensis]|nr:hypothetical protein EN35_03900 [Rhodococcus qingshengii]
MATNWSMAFFCAEEPAAERLLLPSHVAFDADASTPVDDELLSLPHAAKVMAPTATTPSRAPLRLRFTKILRKSLPPRPRSGGDMRRRMIEICIRQHGAAHREK